MSEDEHEHKKKSPFDYIKSVSSTKDYIFENPKDYSNYIVNRGLSLFPDTLLFANDMNMCPNIPSESNYQYYMYSLRKRDRFAKWPKEEVSEDVTNVMEYYKCNKNVAKMYVNSMPPEDLKYINNIIRSLKK